MLLRYVLFLASLGYSLLFIHPVMAKQRSAPAMPPTLVTVAKVQVQPWQEIIHTIGSLAASQGITIHPEINGRVTDILFRSGQTVAKAEPLVQLNPDIIKADLALAQAQLKLSEANYQRQKTLALKQVESKAMLDKALATRNADQAKVERNQALLNQTLIRAPFAGQLGLRQVDVGDFVASGTTSIVNLQALDTLKINFTVPEMHVDDVKVGQKIQIKSDISPETTFAGKVTAYDSLIDPETRTLAVRAEMLNPDHTLLPGGFVNVYIQTSKQQVIAIPQTAVVYAPEGHFVFTVEKNKAHKIEVVTGPRIGDKIVIRKGLKAQDTLVTAGQFKLFEGAPVMIQPTQATP